MGAANRHRRALGQQAIAAFQKACGKDTLETDATDLIADVLHVCAFAGLDIEAIARMAVDHVQEEI